MMKDSGSVGRPEPPHEAAVRGTVLIVDDSQAFARRLGESFGQIGFDVAIQTSFECAFALAYDWGPSLIVTEVRLGAKWLFDFCDAFRELGHPIAVATAYPSIATAVRAVQGGIGVYMAKPVTADMVLTALRQELPQSQPAAPASWPSLDRTIWEYINQVVLEAGSVSEAARRLRLDRRSLRRMLAKHPPAR